MVVKELDEELGTIGDLLGRARDLSFLKARLQQEFDSEPANDAERAGVVRRDPRRARPICSRTPPTLAEHFMPSVRAISAIKSPPGSTTGAKRNRARSLTRSSVSNPSLTEKPKI